MATTATLTMTVGEISQGSRRDSQKSAGAGMGAQCTGGLSLLPAAAALRLNLGPAESTQMQGSLFRFYVHEDHRHHGRLVWEWLLEEGNKLGIRGGSAFKAMAGFGRHHMLHEARFFELAGTLTVEVEFIVSAEEAQQLLELLHREKVRLFYAHTPASFGVINPDVADPPLPA
jgi:PII-like signaling protein